MALSESQIERYARNIMLDEIGIAGQEKLLNSKVLIIGAGGLGSPVAMYLAAAGIGTIGVADGDAVELSNLQRQILHNTEDIGTNKTISAKKRLSFINPDVDIVTYDFIVDAENIRDVLRPYDFVLDCTDNFKAKFLINDACYLEKKPLSHAGILKFNGQLMTILPGISACYRCIFNSPPDENNASKCSRAGVLGVLPGVIGSLQAAEAIKYILGIGELLTNTLLTYDGLEARFHKVTISHNVDCPLCGSNPAIIELM